MPKATQYTQNPDSSACQDSKSGASSSVNGHPQRHTDRLFCLDTKCQSKKHPGFSDRNSLRAHCQKFHATEEFKCELCGEIFRDSRAKTMHYRKAHRDSLYHCSVLGCNYQGCRQSKIVRNHIRIKHPTLTVDDYLVFGADVTAPRLSKEAQHSRTEVDALKTFSTSYFKRSISPSPSESSGTFSSVNYSNAPRSERGSPSPLDFFHSMAQYQPYNQIEHQSSILPSLHFPPTPIETVSLSVPLFPLQSDVSVLLPAACDLQSTMFPAEFAYQIAAYDDAQLQRDVELFLVSCLNEAK